jgi:hypothetical protein
VTFAKEFEAMPRVWGVGRVMVGDPSGATRGQVVPWEMSAADIEDETEVAADHSRALGLGDGDLVLVVALLSQAIHAVPLEQAAGRVGALYSSADATRFDAFRTASLIRQLHAKVVIGVDAEITTGLDDLDRDLAEVFGPVSAVVTADEEAHARLVAAGLRPGRYLRLGPTSAVAPPGTDALVYDAERWQVDEDAGELLLTNLADRLMPCDRFRTGIRGTVPEPGRILLTP